jgi:hypothetical protein
MSTRSAARLAELGRRSCGAGVGRWLNATVPANLFQTHGPDAIKAAINDRLPLGDAMIEQLLRTAGHWSDPAVRHKLVEQAAQILAARSVDAWMDSFTRLNRRLHLSTGFLEHQTVTESVDRERDRACYTQARLDELQERARARAATVRDTSAPTVSDAVAQTTPAAVVARETPARTPEDRGPRR